MAEKSSGKSKRSVMSRVYVHEGCGGGTEVTGEDFLGLVNPFGLVMGTYCSGCEKMVRLDDVAWQDSGESLTKYRRRLLKKAPSSVKLLVWLVTPLTGTALGGAAGWWFSPNQVGFPIVGAVVGMLVAYGTLMPVVVRQVGGVDYRGVK